MSFYLVLKITRFAYFVYDGTYTSSRTCFCVLGNLINFMLKYKDANLKSHDLIKYFSIVMVTYHIKIRYSHYIYLLHYINNHAMHIRNLNLCIFPRIILEHVDIIKY